MVFQTKTRAFRTHLALVAEPSSHPSLRVKPARQVVARISAQGLRQPNGLMRLSQKRGKIICSCMSLGSNLHTCTTLTCGSMASNWLSHICLDWHEIFAIAVDEPENLESLLDKHLELFKEELGTISFIKASLQVQPNARPWFFKPRPVPFALNPQIE